MKCLMYYWDGFIRKFPLKNKVLKIGRGSENDLVLDYRFISREHLRIQNDGDHVEIEDLKSANGTFFKGKAIRKTTLKLNESFFLGGVEFVLKEGDLQEFEAAPELIPIFKKITGDHEYSFRLVRTTSVSNAYVETIKEIMALGLKKESLNRFILELPGYLSDLDDLGDLYLISLTGGTFSILYSDARCREGNGILDSLLHEHSFPLFSERFRDVEIPGSSFRLHSFPVRLKEQSAVLLHLHQAGMTPVQEKFLASLAGAIELAAQILPSEMGEVDSGTNEAKISRSESFTGDIVFKNAGMKRLIDQALLVAGTDLFVLIRGESGTGKELFAKLIHDHSSRKGKSFVALNCAAIPENLLESELFGYEKGAFTGAYQSQKGKLEIASGGTLVLDEVGDMPMNLQTKLLRVLQEHEFYKLGSNRPIRVDLRIISITNQDLKQAIAGNRFRKDLYYRLVHHDIEVPPLRERPEDLPLLIHHFTKYYCSKRNRSIGGYSLKAFAALRECNWDGNVRQLRNEVNRLVSLTPENQVVSFDLLSEEIRQGSVKKPGEISQREAIIDLMIRHGWSVSSAARELNITYQGLYKKMKKLGINRPKNDA